MIVGTPDALRTWVEAFEEAVTEDGGPISMTATFESPVGVWSFVCSRDDGTKIIPPEGHGEPTDVETLLKDAGA